MAAVARVTRAPLPALLAGGYLLALSLLATGGWLIASRMYRTRWAAVALLAALTLRHAIARSGTNTLEGYFHPRQLAFALGALAIAAFLRRRLAVAAGLVILAGLFHPTTALWFAIWVAVAAAVIEPRLRLPLALTAAAATAISVWALTAGPLAGRLAVMDPEWLATLMTKDYLFPLEWPIEVWAMNLVSIPIIVVLYRRRAALGLSTPVELGMVVGCLSLLLVFAVALPLNAARVALAVQLQTPRIFWMLDFLATVYAVWGLAEGGSPSVRRACWTAAVIGALSVTRGIYVKLVRFPDRAIAQLDVADTDWGRVMTWARTTPKDSAWIAHPMHAVMYGTSVRVSGRRDVLVESVKDTAVGMYGRGVAIRTRDRLAEVDNFDAMTPERAQMLAARHGLDYLVTEQPLDLPIAFSSGALRVYRLRESTGVRIQ